MRNFFSKIGEYLRKIRRSDDRTKKRWLVFFSGVGMIFVVALWVAYLNAVLPQESGTSQSTSTVAVAPTVSKEEDGSFFKTFEAGWNVVWGGIKKNTEGIGDSLKNSWLEFKDKVNSTNDLNLEKPTVSSTFPLP